MLVFFSFTQVLQLVDSLATLENLIFILDSAKGNFENPN